MKGLPLPPGGLLLAAFALACGGPERPGYEYFMTEMVRSVAYDSFAPNPVSADGKTLRRAVPGTLPRGFHSLPFGPGPEEAERAGRELVAPFSASPRVLARGRKVFETFCVVCHGEAGLGDGPVIPKFPTPPSFLSERLLQMPEGRMVHVMTHGTSLMPGYRMQVPLEDRWRVTYYIRELQRRGGGAAP